MGQRFRRGDAWQQDPETLDQPGGDVAFQQVGHRQNSVHQRDYRSGHGLRCDSFSEFIGFDRLCDIDDEYRDSFRNVDEPLVGIPSHGVI